MLMDLLMDLFRTPDFAAFVDAGDWVKKLSRVLVRRRKQHQEELEILNKVTFGDPLVLARFYIEPNAQETNPADEMEDSFVVSREPIFRKLGVFLNRKTFERGGNQLFILSDAGMGKTALLTMLKLLHMNEFWPKGTTCTLFKLGRDTLDNIREIRERRRAILLLDALDEDPGSYGRVHERLMELLDATADFNKVIITCRTQFFPSVKKDPLERPGQIVIGGYTCPTKYLSNFDKTQVSKYLHKRFPPVLKMFPQVEVIARAQSLIAAMGALRCRPMLLAHIYELLESPIASKSSREFDIYEALVRAWLNREEAKSKTAAESLWDACVLLANRMQARGERLIADDSLRELQRVEPRLECLNFIDLTGRALLNRRSDGRYRFSHYSIQEFLVAYGILYLGDQSELEPVRATSFIAQLILQESLGKDTLDTKRWGLVDFSEADLRHLNLREKNLRGLHLTGHTFRESDLSDADLTGATLVRCNFSGANLSGAKLDRAVLHDTSFEGARFDEASLREIRATGVTFSKCSFYMADLSNSIVELSNFEEADSLGWTRLASSQFLKCCMARSLWDGPNYRVDPPWGNYNGGAVKAFARRGLHCHFKQIQRFSEVDITSAKSMCDEFRTWIRSDV